MSDNTTPLPVRPEEEATPPFPRGICVVTLAALMCLYLATLPLMHQISDTYEWISVIRNGDWKHLFHPHHLIYTAVAYLWAIPLQHAGLSLWTSVQLLSVLGGLLANAGFFRILWTTTRNARLAILGTFLYGTTFVTWMFSVEAEVYIFAVAGLLWSFVCLLHALQAPSLSRFLLVGCFCGLAGLFHQTACFFLVPSVLAAWISAPGFRQRTMQALQPILGFALCAGIPYILVGVLLADVHSPAELLRWMTKHAQYGYYGGISKLSPLKAAIGWTRGLVYGWHVQDALWARAYTPAAILHGAAMALTVLLAAGFFLYGLQRFLKYGTWYQPLTQPARYALLWFAANAGFSLYYEPHNIEWWVIPMAPFLLIALWSRHTFATPRAGILLLLWLALQSGANLAGDFIPRRSADLDPFAKAVRTMETHGGENALYVVPALMAIRSETQPFAFQIHLREARNSIPRALQTLREAMEATGKRQAPVVFLEHPMDGKVFAYQPQAQPVMQAFTEFLHAHAEHVDTVRLPWKNKPVFGEFARWQSLGVYRIAPGTKAWARFMALLQTLQEKHQPQSAAAPSPVPEKTRENNATAPLPAQ